MGHGASIAAFGPSGRMPEHLTRRQVQLIAGFEFSEPLWLALRDDAERDTIARAKWLETVEQRRRTKQTAKERSARAAGGAAASSLKSSPGSSQSTSSDQSSSSDSSSDSDTGTESDSDVGAGPDSKHGRHAEAARLESKNDWGTKAPVGAERDHHQGVISAAAADDDDDHDHDDDHDDDDHDHDDHDDTDDCVVDLHNEWVELELEDKPGVLPQQSRADAKLAKPNASDEHRNPMPDVGSAKTASVVGKAQSKSIAVEAADMAETVAPLHAQEQYLQPLNTDTQKSRKIENEETEWLNALQECQDAAATGQGSSDTLNRSQLFTSQLELWRLRKDCSKEQQPQSAEDSPAINTCTINRNASDTRSAEFSIYTLRVRVSEDEARLAISSSSTQLLGFEFCQVSAMADPCIHDSAGGVGVQFSHSGAGYTYVTCSAVPPRFDPSSPSFESNLCRSRTPYQAGDELLCLGGVDVQLPRRKTADEVEDVLRNHLKDLVAAHQVCGRQHVGHDFHKHDGTGNLSESGPVPASRDGDACAAEEFAARLWRTVAMESLPATSTTARLFFVDLHFRRRRAPNWQAEFDFVSGCVAATARSARLRLARASKFGRLFRLACRQNVAVCLRSCLRRGKHSFSFSDSGLDPHPELPVGDMDFHDLHDCSATVPMSPLVDKSMLGFSIAQPLPPDPKGSVQAFPLFSGHGLQLTFLDPNACVDPSSSCDVDASVPEIVTDGTLRIFEKLAANTVRTYNLVSRLRWHGELGADLKGVKQGAGSSGSLNDQNGCVEAPCVRAEEWSDVCDAADLDYADPFDPRTLDQRFPAYRRMGLLDSVRVPLAGLVRYLGLTVLVEPLHTTISQVTSLADAAGMLSADAHDDATNSNFCRSSHPPVRQSGCDILCGLSSEMPRERELLPQLSGENFEAIVGNTVRPDCITAPDGLNHSGTDLLRNCTIPGLPHCVRFPGLDMFSKPRPVAPSFRCVLVPAHAMEFETHLMLPLDRQFADGDPPVFSFVDSRTTVQTPLSAPSALIADVVVRECIPHVESLLRSRLPSGLTTSEVARFRELKIVPLCAGRAWLVMHAAIDVGKSSDERNDQHSKPAPYFQQAGGSHVDSIGWEFERSEDRHNVLDYCDRPDHFQRDWDPPDHPSRGGDRTSVREYNVVVRDNLVSGRKLSASHLRKKGLPLNHRATALAVECDGSFELFATWEDASGHVQHQRNMVEGKAVFGDCVLITRSKFGDIIDNCYRRTRPELPFLQSAMSTRLGSNKGKSVADAQQQACEQEAHQQKACRAASVAPESSCPSGSASVTVRLKATYEQLITYARSNFRFGRTRLSVVSEASHSVAFLGVYTVLASTADHDVFHGTKLPRHASAAAGVLLFNGAPVYRLDGTVASFLFLHHDDATDRYSWRIAPALGGLSFWAEFEFSRKKKKLPDASTTLKFSSAHPQTASKGVSDDVLRANADGCTAQRGRWMCWTGTGAFAADETMTVEPWSTNEEDVNSGPSLSVCDRSTRAAVLQLNIVALLRDHGFSGCDLGILRKYVSFMHRCHTCAGRHPRKRDDAKIWACCTWHKCLDQCILAEMLARCFRERAHRCMKAVLATSLSQGVKIAENDPSLDRECKEEKHEHETVRPSDAVLEFRAALSANILVLLGNSRNAHLLQLGVSATGESLEPFWQCQSKAWLASKYPSSLSSSEIAYSFDLRDALKPMGWVFLWNRVQGVLGLSLAKGFSQDGGCSEESREVSPFHNNSDSELLRVVAAGDISSVAKYKQLRLAPVVCQTTVDFLDAQHGIRLLAKHSGCLGVAAIPVLRRRMRLVLGAVCSLNSAAARLATLPDVVSFWNTVVLPCLQKPEGALPFAMGHDVWPFPRFARGDVAEIKASLLKQDCSLLKQFQLVVVRTLQRVARVFVDLQSTALGAPTSTLRAIVNSAHNESEGTPQHVQASTNFFEESVAFSTIIEQALASCSVVKPKSEDQPLATLPVFAGFLDFGAHCSTFATHLALADLIDHYETVEQRYFESFRLQQSIWRFEATQTHRQHGADLAPRSAAKRQKAVARISRARVILAFWACQDTAGIKSVASAMEHELVNHDTPSSSASVLLHGLCLAATALQDCGDWDGQLLLLSAVARAAVTEWPACAANCLLPFEVRAVFQKSIALQRIGEELDPQPPDIYKEDYLFVAPAIGKVQTSTLGTDGSSVPKEDREDRALAHYEQAQSLLLSLIAKFSGHTGNKVLVRGYRLAGWWDAFDKTRRHSPHDALEVLTWLGRNAFCQGQRARAVEYFELALEFFNCRKYGFGPKHPLKVTILIQLAAVKQKQQKTGLWGSDADLMAEAHGLAVSVLTPKHHVSIFCAQWLGNLHYRKGVELYERGEYIRSLSEFEKAISFQQSGYGPVHVRCGQTQYMTARVHEKLDQYDLAFEGYRKGLNIFISAYGPALPPVLSPLGAEGSTVQRRTGTDNTDANNVIDRDSLTKIDGPLCALPLRGMATILFYERSKPLEALCLLRRALSVQSANVSTGFVQLYQPRDRAKAEAEVQRTAKLAAHVYLRAVKPLLLEDSSDSSSLATWNAWLENNVVCYKPPFENWM